jgi:hypothetical protein
MLRPFSSHQYGFIHDGMRAAQLPGVFDGPPGNWGRKRQPLFLGLPA